MKIKWTNRWSGETGFVKSIEADHFVNTYDQAEGCNYRCRRDADKAIRQLVDCGEATNNDFEVISLKK